MHAFEALHRDIELAIFGIENVQEIAGNAAGCERHEALILANAVIGMHDVISGFEIAKRRKRMVFVEFFGGRALETRAKDVGFADDRELLCGQAASCRERTLIYAHTMCRWIAVFVEIERT